MNVDDCLEVRFQNLLASAALGFQPQPRDPAVSRPNVAGHALYAEPERAHPPGFAIGLRHFGQSAARLAGVHAMGMELVKAESPPGTAAAAGGGRLVGRRQRRGGGESRVRASGLVVAG